jgi:hypothetical protein
MAADSPCIDVTMRRISRKKTISTIAVMSTRSSNRDRLGHGKTSDVAARPRNPLVDRGGRQLYPTESPACC